MNNLFTLGAFAMLFDDKGRVLLSHRKDYDLWNLPGGGVKVGELPIEAVIRETKEETGLEISIEKLIGVYGKTNSNDLVFTFLCDVIGGKLQATNEADAHEYFVVNQLPINTIPKQVERINDAVSLKVHPVFRRQHLPSTHEFLKMLKE